MDRPRRLRAARPAQAGSASPVCCSAILLACLAAACAALLAGCETAGTKLVDPSGTTDTTTGGGGTFQRATLVVRTHLDGRDSALAAAVGSPNGVLIGADVVVQRLISAEDRQSAKTDSAGVATFDRLVPGRYTVSVLRRLTAAERGSLGPEEADVTGFGGGMEVDVAPPSSEVTVGAVAGRRGSLVISELSMPIARLPSGADYILAQFLEVYNNSDTTIYLDGKVIVRGQIFGARNHRDFPCDTMARWSLDPEGIWTRHIEAFPGSGRDHPLQPGRTAVIATDAIDHSQFDSRLRDLSHADFEFIGPQDVDNPDVPNMVTLGDPWAPGVVGHGLYFGFTDAIVAVANPVDVATLPQDNLPVLVPRHWRVPRDKILDVLTVGPTPEQEASFDFSPPCPRYINDVFDHQRALLVDETALDGIQRRLLAVLPDGRRLLQRTRTSSQDFFASFPPTPGSVPSHQ